MLTFSLIHALKDMDSFLPLTSGEIEKHRIKNTEVAAESVGAATQVSDT